MIDSSLHPLDEVVLFGHTVHGLIKGNVSGNVLVVDGEEFPVPADYLLGLAGDPGVVQVVRHPEAGPVPLAEDVLAAERAEGRVWQNYAMVQRNGMLFGRGIGGWIHIDSLGRRWVIRPGSMPAAVPGAPYTLTLDCRPFGYFDEAPMEAVSLPVTCPDVQLLTPGPRFVTIETANSVGSRCILKLSTSSELPSGFLEISMSDDEGELAATLTVLRSHEAVRGTWNSSHPEGTVIGDLFPTYALCPTISLAGAVESEGVPYFPEGGGTVTLTVTGVEEVESFRTTGFAAYATYRKGVVEASCGRVGRIVAMSFDEADVLIETTYDTAYSYSGSMPGWSGSAVGSMSNYGEGEFINATAWDVAVTPAVSASRVISESVSQTLTVRRAGSAAVLITNTKSYSAPHNMGLDPLASGDWGWAYIGGFNDIAGVGARGTGVTFPKLANPTASVVATTATAEKGGPWPAEWTTAPTSTTGVGNPEYTSDLPLNDPERDADNLEMAFGPVDYLLNRSAGGGTAVWESEPGVGVALVREIALLFPHAELLARGEEGAGLNVAYHPVDHVIEVSPEPTIDVIFV
jgi:hypothetical protein